MPTHYEVLGVHPEAEPEVVVAAYRALMRKYHPDTSRTADDARAKRTNEAYAVLSNPAARAKYDRSLQGGTTTGQRTQPPQGKPPPPAPAAKNKGGVSGWWWAAFVLVLLWAIGTLTSTPATESAVVETENTTVTEVVPAAAPTADVPIAPGNATPDDVLRPGEVEAISAALALQAPQPVQAETTAEVAEPPAVPTFASLETDDRQSIERVCYGQKVLEGPAAYNRCLGDQLEKLAGAGPIPSLEGLSAEDANSIRRVCYGPKILTGPLAYRACLSKQIADLRASPRPE